MCAPQVALSGALSCLHASLTWAAFSRCLPGLRAQALGAPDSGVLCSNRATPTRTCGGTWRKAPCSSLLPDSTASSSLGARVTRFLQPRFPGTLPASLTLRSSSCPDILILQLFPCLSYLPLLNSSHLGPLQTPGWPWSSVAPCHSLGSVATSHSSTPPLTGRPRLL